MKATHLEELRRKSALKVTITRIIEDALERHGVSLADVEGTLDDAEAIMEAVALHAYRERSLYQIISGRSVENTILDREIADPPYRGMCPDHPDGC